MSGFVIRRNEDGAYVAPPGKRDSYTKDLQAAQRFSTREAAQSMACGNEMVVEVDELLQPKQ